MAFFRLRRSEIGSGEASQTGRTQQTTSHGSTMTGGPELRRRPTSTGKQRVPARRANVTENHNVEAVVSAVLSELASKINMLFRELRLKEMKPWGEFFARFKAPRAWNTSVLDERLTTNFLHYRGNYSLIATGLLVVGIVSNPSVLLALLCCALLVVFLFPSEESPRVVRVAGRTLESSERLSAAVIGVACILGLSGAWYVLLLNGGGAVFLCILHGVFRPRTISSKASRASVDAKNAAAGFSIEGAQHFVEGIFGMNNSRSQ